MNRPEVTDPVLSVIVTTYNRPAALVQVLMGLARQSAPPQEVLVADDGSGPETAELVAGLIPGMPFRLRHIWQEDHGFRAAGSRNRAVAVSTGDYLIFLDGDSIPCADFIRRHLRLARTGWFVAGNRILLDRTLTEQVESGMVHPCDWSLVRWLAALLRRRINRLSPLVFLPGRGWRERLHGDWRKVRTCNLGMWRADLVEVNGFDERYQGWGHEDADLAVRLIRNGIRRLDGRWALPVLHLWHQDYDRANEPGNRERLRQILEGREVRAGLGLDQYGSDSGNLRLREIVAE